jgi:RecA-family ATPase
MPETISTNNSPLVPDTVFLIENAEKNPPEPILEGLLNEGEVAGLHGPQEAFKTMLTLQLAESLATGKPFLGRWLVPKPRSPYYFETEMSNSALGRRLREMFRSEPPPRQVRFADEKRLKQFKRAPNLVTKFALLNQWVLEAEADVVILDTCNPFFRGKQSPNDETAVGEFFDHLDAIPAPNKLFVRHNHKPRMEDVALGDGASRMRGSGQFADVPDLLLEIRRTDKRVNKAELSVTKYRHGMKPDDLTLWFDSGDFRLVAIDPVTHLLKNGPLPRETLLSLLEQRFGVSERKGDQLLEEHPNLDRYMEGHQRILVLKPTTGKLAGGGQNFWLRKGVLGDL